MRALDPDIVVLATGGRSHVHHLPAWGVADGLAVSAWDVLAGRVEPARRVLVHDGVSTHAGAGWPTTSPAVADWSKW